jgi:hypothetical protein
MGILQATIYGSGKVLLRIRFHLDHGECNAIPTNSRWSAPQNWSTKIHSRRYRPNSIHKDKTSAAHFEEMCTEADIPREVQQNNQCRDHLPTLLLLA